MISKLHIIKFHFLLTTRNLAKSIREKATDMALGLVQPRTDLITATPKQQPDASSSPRNSRRPRLTSFSTQKNPINVDIRLDVVLDTPVLVLPRSSCSPHVFVAHLGKISVTNIRIADGVTVDTLNQRANVATATTPRLAIFTIDEEHPTIFSMEELNTTDMFVNSGDGNDQLGGDIDDDDDNANKELETYTIDVRNMNLFSLDTTTRKGFRL